MTSRTSSALPLTFAAFAICLSLSAVSLGANATALVSATVLGSAETEIASGAVSMTRLSDLDFGSIPVSRSDTLRVPTRSPAAYRLQGGYDASYCITLPATVSATNGTSRIEISGFRARSGRAGHLASDGTGTFVVGASATISPGQIPGTYLGSFAVIVAYD